MVDYARTQTLNLRTSHSICTDPVAFLDEDGLLRVRIALTVRWPDRVLLDAILAFARQEGWEPGMFVWFRPGPFRGEILSEPSHEDVPVLATAEEHTRQRDLGLLFASADDKVVIKVFLPIGARNDAAPPSQATTTAMRLGYKSAGGPASALYRRAKDLMVLEEDRHWEQQFFRGLSEQDAELDAVFAQPERVVRVVPVTDGDEAQARLRGPRPGDNQPLTPREVQARELHKRAAAADRFNPEEQAPDWAAEALAEEPTSDLPS